MNKVLWWGRFDPDYSRHRILRQIFLQMDWLNSDFYPKVSLWGDVEASIRRQPAADLLWVPCFRQRDLTAAVRWGQRKGIPVVFDPLISAYDKQVFERNKFSPQSRQAQRLLKWEKGLFSLPDLILADTWEHARFFSETLGADMNKIAVVPVGAEESLFLPEVQRPNQVEEAVASILFYGSFLNLQGPEIIIEAARLYQGPPAIWRMIGEGPLLKDCRDRAAGLTNVEFQPWVPYADLPSHIHQADILLGVFGASAKAGRVIPNKVYQALACGKPLVTRTAPAYPDSFEMNESLGIVWVPPADPQSLARTVEKMLSDRNNLSTMGRQARKTYDSFFSMTSISASLESALTSLVCIDGDEIDNDNVD